MAEIINLKQQRKNKARVEKEQKAAENRRKYGRTKAEKKLEEVESKRSSRNLQGHKLEKDEE